MSGPASLLELEDDFARHLELLNLPPKRWMPEAPEGVLDVAIVGAGLCGLAAHFALALDGIDNVRLFDAAPVGQEGPWVTYARMETLRTAKEAAGPAMGIPSLTFRAWFEAQWGRAAWDDMNLAPREMWMDYLLWYRRMTGAKVVNDCAVREITPEPAGFLLRTDSGTVRARRVVLATGLDALGAPFLPRAARGLPEGRVLHSADRFDPSDFAGKRVVVVGAGASAMDNAAAALEAGCARLDLLVRRPAVPRVDKFTGTGSRGMTAGFVGLSDEDKWNLMSEAESWPVPPPRHSVERVARHKNAHLHVGAAIERVEARSDGLHLTTPVGELEADVAIFATGFGIDLSRRPELAAFARYVRTWGDVVGEAKAARHPALAAHPYLAEDFTFTERVPGQCPALSRIALFAYPSVPTHGKVTSGIPAATEGARRLSSGLVRSFFAEDAQYHLDRFRAYDTPDMTGEEWRASPMPVRA